MAWAAKYQVTFKDVSNVDWIIYFAEDDWGGSITSLTPGETPITIIWNQSDKYQPIIGSVAEIQVVYESSIDALETEVSQSIWVSVYRNASIFWQGFLSPGQYFRQFNKPKHYITLTASDGLGELKGVKFEDDIGDPYYYSETEIVIIANILQKTGITQTIYDAINVYEDSYDATVSDSPLEQTYIWQEKYWDELTDGRTDCYTVLSDILKKYGASVRYGVGHWYLLRSNDYSAHDKIYYRVYTYAGVYSSNTSFTSYNTISSNMHYIYADQEITKLQGAGIVEVTLDPGRRKNDLRNGTFDSFTWSGGSPYYWTNSGSGSIGTPEYDNTKVADTLTLYSNSSATQPRNYICSPNIKLYSCKSIKLTLNYRCYYQLAPTHAKICIGIVVGSGAYYDPENDAWTTTSYDSGTSLVALDMIAESKSSMLTYETMVVEPSTGPFTVNGEGIYGFGNYITIRLYEFWNDNGGVNNWVSFSNVFLEIERDGLYPDTQIYTFTGPNFSTNIKQEQLSLGDSFIDDITTSASGDDDLYWGVTSDAAGASGNETTLWSIKGHVAASEPIAQLLARQIGEGFHKSLDLLRGTIRSAYTYVSHLAFEDTNFKDPYGFNKRYFPMGIEYNARKNEWAGEWVECPAIYADEGLEWDTNNIGGDAVVTGNEVVIDHTKSGSNAMLEFDDFTHIAGQTIRIVIECTDNGSSALPSPYIDGDYPTRAWGTNYYTYYYSSSGDTTIDLVGWDGSVYNCTVSITIYSITGV